MGLSGRYPEAIDVDAYWRNLRDGKDCIIEVPKERWDWRAYYSDDRAASGAHRSKWGGFIAGVDEFDPLFFNISPSDAEYIDPQERLFLEHAWMAVEDAGYTRAALPGEVGVYVGLMYTEYQLFGAEASARGRRIALANSPASIANRVSYFLNLHGPSMTLDTMCSSSLTAIHIACQDLAHGRTSLAIAGGVNVSIHPNKYLWLSNGQFISTDGHCQSFGEGGDGYIPGEGVGAVVLKRLSEAERDGDHIYGVIRGSALNHGGKTNGYSVPNPQAQANVISRVLTESHTDARHISYIEAHGTGTKLGDPIEITALAKAFGRHTQDTGFCLIGSAKSNIGHCESAAGIAGLTKVLLQMQHRQIVPSLHSAQLNPHIDFEATPFVVNQELRPWEQPVVDGRTLPRIAGISSFGAGGANAHLIVEEYQPPARQPMVLSEVVILLSAKTAEQLRQQARALLDHMHDAIDLTAVAYTLQVGREAMEHRLGFLVRSAGQLADKLQAWLAGEQGIEDACQGQLKRNSETLSLFSADDDLQLTVDRWIANGKLSKLLDLWVKGLEVDWSKLYGDAKPPRVSLPTYPFAKERCWIDTSASGAATGAVAAVLHPLLHSNTSDFSEQRYRSTFTGDEFFLADHQVAAQKVLPAVAYLEMARAAIEQASPARPEATVLELVDTVWAQPIIVSGQKEISISLRPSDDDQIDYEIRSADVVHCQGRAVLSRAAAPPPLDLEQLGAQMGEGRLEPDSVYAACARMGLVYGPSFRTITAVHKGAGQVLARLRLPESVQADGYVLHPSIMDGALQAAVGLMDGASAQKPRLPFALASLRIVAPCAAEMVAWVRYAPGSQADLDIDLCDERGNVCVQLRGLSSRLMGQAAGTLLVRPVWEERAASAQEVGYADRHVVRCDAGAGTLAQRYTGHAVACFERIKALMQSKPQGRVLVQVVVPDEGEQAVLAGLSGLLRTAALENPQITGQLLLVPPSANIDERLQAENGHDPLVRYENGTRYVSAWREIAVEAEAPPIAFRDSGVYLITGGMGGLGQMFAREILDRAPGARVILTGRSAVTAANYRQVDLGDADQVRQLIAGIIEEHGQLDGILHSAGMIADAFILKKESAQFAAVLAPKVAGAFHLDQATRDVPLDFFVLFSSFAGPVGNPGQADYAAANGFLDHFAAYRNRQQRHGRTLSINWPLWQSGGMQIDAASREVLQQATGMQPMQTATGMDAFHRGLASPYDQIGVMEGDPARMRRVLLGVSAPPAAPRSEQPAVAIELAEQAQDYLRKLLSGPLKLPSHRIDPHAALEEYGIDSILAVKLTNQLEKTFGPLSKTLFFEYQTIRDLAEYFLAHHGARLAGLLSPEAVPAAAAQAPEPAKVVPSRRFIRSAPSDDDPIAIIGLSGRYPEAFDVDAYWRNLRDGKDCITEVPKSRWDWREFYSDDRTRGGHHYSKWGGFMEGVDEFDPLFFNISPAEAELMDPQERLFLQHAWMAMEDAGYTRAGLQVPYADDLPGQVGVYVGVMYSEYQLFGAEAAARGKRVGIPGSAAGIANRVSYALNLHGPSMMLDTMCSSSLTAIHIASLELKLGRISMAIAGGVNVTIHPNKYLVLSGGQFISGDGHCQSFGEGGDGYIPGEGVGAVILKRLSDAKRDGDHVYAIIRGSALNHGGKTNGYTVPNPQAQATVISRALAESRVDPRHISYIEAHGTGTKLGDPIEIAALGKAFGRSTQDTGFCLIGSAKSNIGHCESAAGIAGLTKVLLQLEHRQIVPSLHSAELNPHIDFAATPFVVNQALRPWEQPVIDGRQVPRIAGISSFGAGGSNAHVIVEEYPRPSYQPMAMPSVVIVLSARTDEQLRQSARNLLDFMQARTIDLAAVAYTLQVGREAMEHRLGFVVSSAEELAERLRAYVAGEEGIEGTRNVDALSLFSADADLKAAIDKWIAAGKLSKLLELWVHGLDLDWSKLYGGSKPPRISLPTYPFARERHWIDTTDVEAVAIQGAALHPLLHRNTSDLGEQRYTSTFTGDEFFLADHQVRAQKVLPAVAYLEMARAAVEHALPADAESPQVELRNVVWAEPLTIARPKQVSIGVTATDDEAIDYEIYSQDGERLVVHGQGRALLVRDAAPAPIDLQRLEEQMPDRMEPGSLYAACARVGLDYGPAFRGVVGIRRGSGQLLARLRLPAGVESTKGDYVLHPSLMDSALHACVALMDGNDELRVPFALDSLRIFAPCTPEMVAWIRSSGDRADIDLCDERGNVCVQLHGLSSHGWRAGRPLASLFAAPVWEASGVVASASFAERHVITCAGVDAKTIAQRYGNFAVTCFETIQTILRSQPREQVLLQVVVRNDGEEALFAGLSGMLKTAALENPRFTGQLVLVPPDIDAEQQTRYLREAGLDPVVKYENGERHVLRWQEVAAADETPIAFEEQGVYLITGGTGSLGQLFAKEILDRAPGARVILTGRSPLTAENYRQVDLADSDQVNRLIAGILFDHHRLDGILHCAGMIADGFILKKTAAEFSRVLEPKVTGTFHLDQATQGVELDFFVLFSSVAGALGNPGQADYAAANGFMDQFAAHRNRRVAAGERRGRTLSINWPLWQAGGMSIDAESRELLQQTTGMQPMQTATGMRAFHRSLAMPHDQVLVVEGDLARMRRALAAGPPVADEPRPVASEPAVAESGSLLEQAKDYLRQQFAPLLKLPAHKIDAQAALEKYGIDSILAMKLTNQLEKTFGSLSKTLFYEYQTIAALAAYFVRAHPAAVRQAVGVAADAKPPAAREAAARPAIQKRRRAFTRASQQQDIAIVGLAGRYPQAENLQEFWRNLRGGRDCITEIPSDRWDHRLYFDPEPKAGKSYSKWGGFLADVDKFDPLFFSISPKEAAVTDPQERLFLETAWQTIEDAGYTRERIAGSRVGVYVGVMWGQYELFAAESMLRGKPSLAGTSYASIANRVSYFFDLHGPSMAVDTMCSSSLTAIHLACEELRKGEIEAAIAGGVNLAVHPYKYVSLSQGRYVASDGRCRSFGAGGDGYVPGEGVGAVLLKPLDSALRDGDQIYAVIKASSLNHGGKTNGYSVPNPNAQADLIREVLQKAHIDPATLSYVETHGTGTSLGDPIEITGLVKAFEGSNSDKQFCPIGSVKSNIGHLESAAGIAAVTKTLLQIRHKELVPSLHAEPLNPHIDFAGTPFYVQTALAEWKRPAAHPRRAGVSSFGAGGSNAHLILEEHSEVHDAASGSPELFVLSARDADALRRYAERVAQFLEDAPDVSLANIAYTSQVGRTAMDARLAVIASSVEELRGKLRAPDFQGNVKEAPFTGNLIDGPAGQAFLGELLANRELEKIARLWILGVDVDWMRMSRPARPRRVSLPTYPFARERCWVDQEVPAVHVEAKRTTYYRPEWVPQPIAATDGDAGAIVVLDASDELFLALKERVAGPVVLVRPGESFEGLTPRVIVHHQPEDGDVAQALDHGVHALFDLCKALMQESHDALRIVSVFTGGPLGAAMGGFLETLTLENPRYLGKTVEMEKVSADLVLNEIHDSDWTAQEVRYRSNARFVRRLVPHTPARAPLPLRRNGVYLITGGMGGLGLVFAEHLAKSYQARLVLVGRSAPKPEALRRLTDQGAEVLCLQGDVARLEDAEAIVREAKARFSAIHGVIHAAGVNRDALLIRKTREELDAVLAAKVYGTINIDRATRGEDLDWLVLFSSLAGVTGNPGQSDYAFANRFLDAFAEQRSGRTLSIAWPLWEEGGMGLSREGIALLEKRTGLTPLPSAEGIRCFEELLRSEAVQCVPLYGVPSTIAAHVAQQVSKPRRPAPAASDSARTEAYLKALIGEEIKLDPDRIGSSDPLESFGLDSVMINRLNARLESDLGPLPKTLFYEHETVRDLAAFLMQQSREAPAAAITIEDERVARPAESVADAEPIAIIGMHGYYPHSPSAEAYWENLKQGRDLIDLVPAERWDYRELYDADPAAAAEGKIYCKWGGFLDHYDKFDPHFFHISTAEAKAIDPQERLFLQSVWAAIEDAGYTRDSLRTRFAKQGSADVGVFVGVTTNSYHLWAPEERTRGNFVSPTSLPWSIANRVSYFFDFNGPSLPVDTACSSSLVALHLACESLRSGDCQVAVAGGVNLYLHPAKYQSMCQRRMLSGDGKTHSYGAGDDGFIPGEGLGTLVLKPLSKAIEHQDHIYAVIRASAFDHSGRSNGYSAPNPNSQASLISHTLEKAGIHPESIGYVEGHGTGTQLGDSLEIAALTQAFRRQTAKKQFCPIGSVKGNVGHSESAAGVAGVAKVILQMEHRQLAPSINAGVRNPNIEFGDSPFYLQDALAEWPSSGQPRRALVNSFGAGGVNACVVLEESPNAPAARTESGPHLFALSAKNEERLREYADGVLASLRGERGVDLASLCYTLQVGREAMEERLAIVVADAQELVERLGAWSRTGAADGIHRGSLKPRRGSRRAKVVAGEHDLAEIAARWTAGEEVDWESLHAPGRPRRISAPTYPFARERYWISDSVAPQKQAPRESTQLHPLIACNSSMLQEVSFSSLLSDSAFYAVDHKVLEESVFPGAGFLEMACISGNMAGEQKVRRIRDVVWIQPLSFRGGPQSLRTVLRPAGEGVEYAISSLDDENEPVVHAEGRLMFGGDGAVADDRMPLEALKAQCARREEGAELYRQFGEYGLHYGPSFRTVQELHVDGSFALARLKIADHLKGDFGQFILHPSMIDGALQAAAGLAGSVAPRTPYLPFAVDEIEILRPVPHTCYAYAERSDGQEQNHAGVTKFNIRLLSESGDVLVRITNLYVRPLPKPLGGGKKLSALRIA
ncbi:MAG TPA: SDR family NAD(P)-dependent oxidoreductase [Thermoanaerobaculia bacterium]|nr:SDR family NAD(P)-dependent oxidoreductase [Thermoanaerobaculia bacterium]